MTRIETKSRPLVVVKYGGSSLANTDYVRQVAGQIIAKKDQGIDLVVVVSAMGKTTDEFIRMAMELNPAPDRREMDMLLSVGERISIALMAIAINAMGHYQAVSFTGSQIGIITDDNHTQARILEIKGLRLREALAEGKIVIVAGFQGVSIHKEITTLGRGGSDTTAVALAAALDADYCEIMSDIDGIYTADPKLIPTARVIAKIDYDTALEMASAGAKMLHKSSLEVAKRHQVKLFLGSTFTGNMGTIVTDESLDKSGVQSVVLDKDVIVLSGHGASPDVPLLLSQNRIQIKIWQSVAGHTVFAISKNDLKITESILPDFSCEKGFNILSIIGTGIGIGSKSAERFFRNLNIDIKYLQSGEKYLKVLVLESEADAAYRIIHKEFFKTV
jgi:aspartate kinase